MRKHLGNVDDELLAQPCIIVFSKSNGFTDVALSASTTWFEKTPPANSTLGAKVKLGFGMSCLCVAQQIAIEQRHYSQIMFRVLAAQGRCKLDICVGNLMTIDVLAVVIYLVWTSRSCADESE